MQPIGAVKNEDGGQIAVVLLPRHRTERVVINYVRAHAGGNTEQLEFIVPLALLDVSVTADGGEDTFSVSGLPRDYTKIFVAVLHEDGTHDVSSVKSQTEKSVTLKTPLPKGRHTIFFPCTMAEYGNAYFQMDADSTIELQSDAGIFCAPHLGEPVLVRMENKHGTSGIDCSLATFVNV